MIDIFPLITLEMLAPDGLHLAQSGNQVLAETYFARIKERYEEAAGDDCALEAAFRRSSTTFPS